MHEFLGPLRSQDLQEFLCQVLVMLSDAFGGGDHAHSPQTVSHPADARGSRSMSWNGPLQARHGSALVNVIASERGSWLVQDTTGMDSGRPTDQRS